MIVNALLMVNTMSGTMLAHSNLEPIGSDKWRIVLYTCFGLHTPRCTIGAREELQLNELSHFTTFGIKTQ